MTLGQKLSPVLAEIEDTLWEHEANVATPFEFTDEGFRGAVKIFMTALFDVMWKKQKGMSRENRLKQAQEAGLGARLLIKQYTGINILDMYEIERKA